MISYIPPPQPIQAHTTPTDVDNFLLREGWLRITTDYNHPYYQKPGEQRYFTWEQALLYTAFLKLNLGG